MPKSTKPDPQTIPSTLERSPKKALETYEKTLASAENEYPGDEARAHRAAWGSVKHEFEKVGDHWEAKSEHGPSDPRSASGGPNARGASFGGVDMLGHSRDELVKEAQSRGIAVPSRATKSEIATLLEHDNTRATRKHRAKQ